MELTPHGSKRRMSGMARSRVSQGSAVALFQNQKAPARHKLDEPRQPLAARFLRTSLPASSSRLVLEPQVLRARPPPPPSSSLLF